MSRISVTESSDGISGVFEVAEFLTTPNHRRWHRANFNSFIRIQLTKAGIERVHARGDSVFEGTGERVWIGPLWLAFSIFGDYLDPMHKPVKNMNDVFADVNFQILAETEPET